MGIDWSKIGNISYDSAKAAGKAGLAKGKSIGTAAGKGLLDYGSSLLNVNTLVAAGAAGATGYALADADNRTDAGKIGLASAATIGAMSGIPGVAAAGTAVGVGGLIGASTIGGAAMGLGRMSLKVPDAPLSFGNIDQVKFSKLGVGLVMGAGMVEGVTRAANKYEQNRMGQNDGMLRSQTPVIPQRETPAYANNGGATGDLVFSMYNNRK